jgi:hypothetical protein
MACGFEQWLWDIGDIVKLIEDHERTWQHSIVSAFRLDVPKLSANRLCVVVPVAGLFGWGAVGEGRIRYGSNGQRTRPDSSKYCAVL